MQHFRFAFAIMVPVTRIGSESTQPRREYLKLAKAGHITPELAPPIPLLRSRTPYQPIILCCRFRPWPLAPSTCSIRRWAAAALLPASALHAGGSFASTSTLAAPAAPASAPPRLCTSRLTATTEHQRTWTGHRYIAHLCLGPVCRTRSQSHGAAWNLTTQQPGHTRSLTIPSIERLIRSHRKTQSHPPEHPLVHVTPLFDRQRCEHTLWGTRCPNRTLDNTVAMSSRMPRQRREHRSTPQRSLMCCSTLAGEGYPRLQGRGPTLHRVRTCTRGNRKPATLPEAHSICETICETTIINNSPPFQDPIDGWWQGPNSGRSFRLPFRRHPTTHPALHHLLSGG
jgi:hypothetical protein